MLKTTLKTILILSVIAWVAILHPVTQPSGKTIQAEAATVQNQAKPKKKYKGKSKSKKTSNYVIRKDYYKVRSGDSLARIASRTHTTVNNLVKLNHLKSTSVHPGQRLLIRVRQVKKSSLRYSTYPDTPPLIEPKPIIEGELTFYTVKEGETMESIAEQYGLTSEEIREANLMPEGSAVKKGQILAIPHEEETPEKPQTQPQQSPAPVKNE